MAEGLSSDVAAVRTSMVRLEEEATKPSRSLWGEAFTYIGKDKLTL